ncbi:MAG: TonB family protein [bacterium]
MSEFDTFELKSQDNQKDFRKTLSDRIDKRFYSILLSSLTVHILLVCYFLANPISKEHKLSKIAKIQENLARAITGKKVELTNRQAKFEFPDSEHKRKEKKVEKKEKPTAPKVAQKKSQSKKSGSKKRTVTAKSKRGRPAKKVRTAKEIAKNVGSKGLLGLLTTTSSIAQGSEVEDIIVNTNQSQHDLDKVLSNLTATTSSGGLNGGGSSYGKAGGRVKGGRKKSGGNIDDLVGELGKTKTESFKRSGDLMVVNEAPLIEGDGKTPVKGRDQNLIQAVVVKHNKSIQYCYEKQLRRNPNLKGKVVIRFTITAQGVIKNAHIVSSTLNNRKIEQCVLSRIRRWSDFGSVEPSYGDTTIRQVYAFGY